MAGRKPRESGWGAGNVLLFDLSAYYLGVFSGENLLTCTLPCTPLYVILK